MLKFIEGFDSYGPDGTQFAALNNAFDTGWILGGSSAITFGPGFTDATKAVYLTRGGSSFSYIERRFESEDDTIIIGFQFRANRRFDGILTIPGVLTLDWPSVMSIAGVEGTAVPILNTGYHAEIKLVKSTQEFTMRLNGRPYIAGTLTGVSNIPDILPVRFGFDSAGATAQAVISNVHFVDGSPGRYTDFIGPQLVWSDRPTDSVDPITWDPIPPEKTNVQIMSNVPPKINEFTQSDEVGTSDYYTSSTPIDGPVTAVAVTTVLAKTDIDDQYVGIGVGHEGERKEGPDREVPIQPLYMQQVFETDEDDNDWTAGTATAVPFGVTIRPRP